MKMTEAMFAQGLVEFLREHLKEYEEFLGQRWNIDDGRLEFFDDDANRRIGIRLKQYSQDQSQLSETDFHIRIE